ncbi:MAG: DUF1570 domain-containing protein [Isosphaeraceae bacterium]|nr:DUF1570 domain-containing protein [Isosphaeraceae bacterium]
MNRAEPPRGRTGPTLSRRTWLAGALASAAATRAQGADEREAVEAEERARAKGLKPFRTLRSKHYVAVGNAPEEYLRITLLDCEDVARDFIEQFQVNGFKVAYPAKRMTAVVLEDERAYARFVPERTPHGANGIYVPKANWLVVQDFRSVPRAHSDVPVWADNLRTLSHEATHQLTYNTGLLNREGDVPRCVSEGLGLYGEIRRPRTRSLPGQLNRTRLSDLAHYRRGLGWIPLSRLITDESWFGAPDGGKILLSYAESWLLVHYMMADTGRAAAFRKYLEAIYGRRAGDLRLNDARTHLGDLEKLDGELKQYSVQLLKSG